MFPPITVKQRIPLSTAFKRIRSTKPSHHSRSYIALRLSRIQLGLMPAYPYYINNRPVFLDGTIHYPRSRLSLTVQNIIQTYYEARRLDYIFKYKNNDSDDDIGSDDEIDSNEDRDSYDLMRIERLQYRIDIRRATTRSYSPETGVGYSKEVKVEDIKEWSQAGSDEEGLFRLAHCSCIISEAIKHYEEIRGPASDGWAWKEEDRLLGFLWFLARHGKLFTAAI
ncbi:hypothetical protein E4T56_gene18194 [Termitomyces sp. T112]|nr:hypothetical protein E4T56_gene18194 [Termitomyces sp. T112]